jgi:integrase
VAFVDMKWPRASAKQRRSIAEALATVTPALLATERGAPDVPTMRAALYGWVFNKAHRDAGPPPDELAPAVRWLAANTVKLTALGTDAALVRKALDALALRLDGKTAAPNTVARKRAVFYGALRYAVELRLLDTNPIDHVQWTPERSEGVVDRRVVVNPTQARALLAAVREIEPELEAFFACIYYAALRPAEVLHLTVDDCELPEQGWGWLHLRGSTQHAGSDWTDTGEAREDRGLKHRARSSTRDVPAPPPLVQMLRHHIETFGMGPGGRLFPARGHRRGPVSVGTYLRVWRQARAAVLTDPERSPLARRPYDLRHACVSLWLNAGVPATQVAEWAGHSVHVLLKVYAKCIDGQDEAARRRIEAALGL